MLKSQLQLIVGPNNYSTFVIYLILTLGKSDNGQTYHEEDVNKFVYAYLSSTNCFKNKY